jgi:L-alanine-DL-glutamate epimerase-like enolase superfamily enzyme
MKIIGIEMFPISMTFERKVKTAFRGTGRDEGVSEDNVVIRIYTDDGISDLGEGGTWGIYYCGESQETVMDVIAYYLFPQVYGDNPASHLTRLLLVFSLSYLLCLALTSLTGICIPHTIISLD